MQKFQAILDKYRTLVNGRISIRSLVLSVLVFACGLHLYYILWQLMGAQAPALVYANIAIRASLALIIIYLLWQGYQSFWSQQRMARYLDLQHDAGDDLYQNSHELFHKYGSTPVTEALVSSSIARIESRKYAFPPIFSYRRFFVISFILAGILGFWALTINDFGLAARQFYTNKAPKIIYKDTLSLSPGNISIGKNQPLLIQIEDPDPRLNHKLYFRTDTQWRELGLSNNHYLFNRLESSIEYYAENEITKSPIFKVNVLDEPMVRNWKVHYQYPAYTGISPFTDSLSYGNIEAYAHSKVILSIQTNIPVKSAKMVMDSAKSIDMIKVDDTSFSVQISVLNPETWYLDLEDHLGRKSRPEEKMIRIIPDSPPQIKIVFPGSDTVLNQNLMLPMIIAADDDFGLANCSLHYQVNSDPAQSTSIQNVITSKIFNTDFLWDMKNLNLFPGDVVTYWVEIHDNAPNPQKGISTRYRARFPSIEEIYQEIERQETQKKEELAVTLEQSKDLQKQFEDKRRELLKDPNLKWEDKKQLENILEKQQDLSEQVENIADNYRDLINKMQANSTLSQETLDKMMKIQELMEEISSEEFQKAMQRFEQALQNVTPDAVRKAMEDFKFSMEDFAKKIEQTLQLLESIKNEQAMQKALQIAEEMERMQKDLKDRTLDPNQDPNKLAADQAQIQEKFDTLQKELEKLKDQLSSPKDASIKQQLEDLLKDMKQSGTKQDMQSSQQSLSQNQRSQSQSSQEQALEKMRRFTMKLGEMKQSMGSGSQQGMMQAIQTAIRELLIFSKKHESTKAKYSNDPYLIVPELIAAYEGIQISLNKLFSQPMVTMIIPPKFFLDLTDTNKGYRDIFGSLGQSFVPNISPQLTAIQKGLNLMVYDLMQALQNSSSGGGGGGGMQSLMQMLEQMGQEQMAMNMLTQQLMMQMQAQGGRMDAGMQQQFQKLASDQERLAENLKRALQNNPEAQKQGNTMKQLIEEAEAVARQIRQNQFTPDLLKRQENIISRLLDAQRSITKRDTSERRQAESSTGLPEGAVKQNIDYETLRRAMILEDNFKSYPKEYQQLIMEYLRVLQDKVQK